MKRFYYMSDSLDELEHFEHDLESRGIPRTQIYLLSNDEVGLESHDVNRVASFLRTDVIHSGEIGALFGLVLAAAILLTANLSGIVEQTTWVPFIFLAIVASDFPPGKADSLVCKGQIRISLNSKKRWIRAFTCCSWRLTRWIRKSLRKW